MSTDCEELPIPSFAIDNHKSTQPKNAENTESQIIDITAEPVSTFANNTNKYTKKKDVGNIESQAVDLTEPISTLANKNDKIVLKSAPVIKKVTTLAKRGRKKKVNPSLNKCVEQSLKEIVEDKLQTHATSPVNHISIKTYSKQSLQKHVPDKPLEIKPVYDTKINVKRQKFNLGNITVHLITPYSDYQQNRSTNLKDLKNQTSNLFGEMFDNKKLSDLRNQLINSITVSPNFNILLLSETWLIDIPISAQHHESYDCIVQFKHALDKDKKIFVNHAEDGQAEMIGPHMNINFSNVDQVISSSTDIGEINICESTTRNGKIVIVLVHVNKNHSASSIRNFLLHHLLPYTAKGATMFEAGSAEHVYHMIPMILAGHFNVDFRSADYSSIFEFLRNDLLLQMAYEFPKTSILQGLTINCSIFARCSDLFQSKISVLFLNRYHLQVIATRVDDKAVTNKNKNKNSCAKKTENIIEISDDDESHEMDVPIMTRVNQTEQLLPEITQSGGISDIVISNVISESEVRVKPQAIIIQQYNNYGYCVVDNDSRSEPELIIP